jgi:hypothetical protein
MRAVSLFLAAVAAGLALAEPPPKSDPPARPPDATAKLCDEAPPPPACKVCVREPKASTRKVYACKCEDYCLPCCDWRSWLRGACRCDGGPCGELRTRHRLVVKKVPACDATQCVPRELPVAGPGAGAPKALEKVADAKR